MKPGAQRSKASSKRWGVALWAAAGLTILSAAAVAASPALPRWWDSSADEEMHAYVQYPNAFGRLGVLNETGRVLTKDHAFLTPIGTNGRACITCHQPGNAMSASVESLRARWNEFKEKDPVFAAIDGANCPTLPQGERASHSLLLDHGLFRIPRPWPPVDLAGKAITPEFEIEVVRDPTGCNLDKKYGLKSAEPTVSVFRRPRVTANMRFVTSTDVDPAALIGNKNGLPRPRDPDTGQFFYLPILGDGGQPAIQRQSNAAAAGHLGFAGRLSAAQLKQIDDFLAQVYVAQDYSNGAGQLSGPESPPGLGTAAYKSVKGIVFAIREDEQVFKSMEMWRHKKPRTPQEAFQASVVRGYDVFFKRPMLIRDVPGFNDIGMGNPYKRTCTFCHNVQLSGIDSSPGFMDIGVENLPTANPAPHLPLFKLTCKASAPPHPYLGRVIYSHDPGRALISGRCADIGSVNLQQLRGLTSRAPYFMSGAAKDLRAVVDYYNTRFDMKLTTQEQKDLINFLSVL